MGKGLMTRRLPTNHDVILCYEATASKKWNQDSLFVPYDPGNIPESVAEKYTLDDGDGRLYQLTSLINPSQDRPNLTYEFMGVTRVWRWTRDRMEDALKQGLIHQSAPGRVPRFKRFLSEQRGMPLGDVWSDIPPLNSQARERLGYPTQKPTRLLDRIVRATTDEGDVVLDPFCGCGTTIAASLSARRNWIGIDVAYHAIKVIEERIAAHPGSVEYQLGGIPRDFDSARRLAEKDKYQFQWWANYLVGVQRLKETKKGPDRGIDGEMYFMNGPRGWGRVLTSVKGGNHVGAKDIREFRSVLDRERAEMGLFICLHPGTRDMNSEAASFGYIETAHGHLPRLQIVAIEEWFRGKRPVLPSLGHVSKEFFEPEKRQSAKKVKRPDPSAPEFSFTFTGGKSDDTVVHLNPAMVREPQKALL
jgi:site-specific DNA-methyltransferase (adenine-specific)